MGLLLRLVLGFFCFCVRSSRLLLLLVENEGWGLGYRGVGLYLFWGISYAKAKRPAAFE
jgi:hypothetical protein